MAIIKKGITYGGTPVNTLTYDGTQVKEVWYGDDKLVYFYGEGTQGLSYTKSGNELQVSGKGTSLDSSIIIPTKTYEYLDGNTIYNVAEILSDAFYNRKIISIDIGNCVVINSQAFMSCTALKRVVINSNCQTIGRDAFKGCYSINFVTIADLNSFCKINFYNKYSNPLNTAEMHLYKDGSEITAISSADLTAVNNIITIPVLFQNCSNLTTLTINSYNQIVKVVFASGSTDSLDWSIKTLQIINCAIGTYFDAGVFTDSFETVSIYMASTWVAYDGDTIVDSISPTGPTGTNWKTFFNNNVLYKIQRTA